MIFFHLYVKCKYCISIVHKLSLQLFDHIWSDSFYVSSFRPLHASVWPYFKSSKDVMNGFFIAFLRRFIPLMTWFSFLIANSMNSSIYPHRRDFWRQCFLARTLLLLLLLLPTSTHGTRKISFKTWNDSLLFSWSFCTSYSSFHGEHLHWVDSASRGDRSILHRFWNLVPV